MVSICRLGGWMAAAVCGALLWTEGHATELDCEPAPGGGSALSTAPTLLATLADRWHESWLGSPAVADLDGDDVNEILATRGHLLLGWHLDGTEVYRVQSDDQARFYAPPVVADMDTASPGLEVAAAAGDKLYLWNAAGALRPGFPVVWLSELRAVAADDIDGDGAFELVVVSTQTLDAGGQSDVVMAYEVDGQPVTGFPPNTTGASGCDSACYVYGGYGLTLALGDLDGDGAADLVVPHDNAYASAHSGDGWMFDANIVFASATKFAGVRSLFDYDHAKQGWTPDAENENQTAHTNSAPAIADLDDDGTPEIVLLGAAQNASQSDRERGVGLWVLNSDGTRASGWESPYHAPDYLAGLWYIGNLVGITNEVAVAELDPSTSGPELVFAGFDGKIHAVSSARQLLWSYPYTTSAEVFTSGVLVVDLSGDGIPEIVFNTYSVNAGESDLFVLAADGALQHRVPIAGRGAMPVPTVADADGDGDLEIVVSHKDAVDMVRQVEVYTVPGSSTNCMLWPTARANLARTGFVPLPEPGGTSGLLFGILMLAGINRIRHH